MSMNDNNGCTMCRTAREERYERFMMGGRIRYQYDYRASNGVLFSCVRPTLEACRTAKDAWLQNKGLED